MRKGSGAILIAATLSGCNCGGTSLVECSQDGDCPTGYRCDPTQQLCARNDGGAHPSDAGSDAAAVDGGRDARRLDVAMPDTAIVVVDTGTSDRGGNDSNAPVDGPRAVDAARPPTTLTITPADGTLAVPSDQQITLVFSADMEPISVEAAFSLTDSSGAAQHGNWTWVGKTAVVVPDPLTPGMRYVALLGGGCVDALGDPFFGTGGTDCSAPAQCAGFVVGNSTPPTVTSTPVDGATDVALESLITLTFSNDMDMASVRRHVVVDGIEVTTAGAWVGSRVLAFQPQTALDCSKLVQVGVEIGARDLSGLELVSNCSLTGLAFCATFMTIPMHDQCEQCSDGCWDVMYATDGGCTCLESFPAPGDSPPCDASDYCEGCDGCLDRCACVGHCHYRREERLYFCNCRQVCS